MSGLYNRSLQDIAVQEKRTGRGSPYSRQAPSSRPSADEKWQHDMYNNAPREGNGRQTGSDAPTQKLLVEGLHYEISNAELEGLFQQIGPTEKCFIRYDRSGRSTGTATVIYREVGHAVNAKREYDGANAKGQPISISYEVYRDFAARNAPGAPTGPASAAKGADLMSRLGGGDLGSRIGGGANPRGAPPRNAPKGPSQAGMPRPGPQRTVSGEVRGRGGFPRGGRGRGGSGRGTGRGAAPTASSLDDELDAFMKTPSKDADAPAEGDVEMK